MNIKISIFTRPTAFFVFLAGFTATVAAGATNTAATFFLFYDIEDCANNSASDDYKQNNI